MKLPAPIDGWDAAALASLALVTGGTSALAGPAWASILLGLAIGAACFLRQRNRSAR